MWYKELQQPEQFVDDTAQVFLGLRWPVPSATTTRTRSGARTTTGAWPRSSAASAARTIQIPGGVAQPAGNQRRSIFNKPHRRRAPTSAPASRPRSSRSTPSRWTSAADDDPRQKLVDWMVDPKNPFFARAVANRYWAHFFGRGIVDPLDDMRVTNPPSNPELLDALAKDLVDNKFSLKHLIKTICKSRTYQLSAMPNEFNKHDKQNYARYYPKRMSAEVLFDAVSQVTDSPAAFGGLPQRQARSEAGDHAAGRVVPVVLPRRVRPAAADQRLRVRARQRGEPGPGAAPAELATRCRAS